MNSDKRIDDAVAALRMSAVPEGAAQDLKLRLRNHDRPRSSSVRTVGLAAGAAVALALVIVAWPKPSYADEISQIFQAQRLVGNRHEIQRVVDPVTGTWSVAQEIWSIGSKAKLAFDHSATLYVDGDRHLNDFLKEGYASVVTRKDESVGSLVTLSYVLRDKHTRGWAKAQTRLDGRVVDKYTLTLAGGGKPTTAAYYVDPSSKRFVKIELRDSGQRLLSVVDLSYGNVSENDVAFRPRPGEPLFDYDEQRKAVLEQIRRPSLRAVNGRVGICAVIIDRQGNLQVVVSGPNDCKTDPSQPVIVDEKPVTQRASAFDVPMETVSGSRLEGEGNHVFSVAAIVKGLQAGHHDIQIPLLIDGRKVAARITGVQLLETGSVSAMLTPTNMPFWIQPSLIEEGSPTRVADLARTPGQ